MQYSSSTLAHSRRLRMHADPPKTYLRGTTTLMPHTAHTQSVGKEALTDDHRLAYWHSRYTLRKASAESTHSNPGSPATTAGLGPRHPSVLLGGSGSNAGSPDHLRGGGSAAAAEALQLDVPVFLRGVADTILTTGAWLA